MKTIKLIALAALALLFSQCKTTAPTATNPGSTASLLEVHQLLDSTQAQFIQFANQTNGDPAQSMALTLTWVGGQPNVNYAYMQDDSASISIVLNSGLQCNFYFDQLDSAGYSMYRGGGNVVESGEPILSTSGTHSENTITNKKVLLFAADTRTLPSVEDQIAYTLKRITKSGLGLDVTVLRNAQCSYGVVEHFGDYGLVIMDTHGNRDGFLVGSTLDLSGAPKNEDAIKSAITGQIDATAYDKLTAGMLMLQAKVSANPSQPNWQKSVIPKEDRAIFFSSKYIDLLPPMPNTVIFGNMCYSGWTAATVTQRWSRRGNGTHRIEFDTVVPIRGVGSAFIGRNPISYYGYIKNTPAGESRPVPDPFAARMEDSLVRRLVANLDSTRIVHLVANNSREYYDPGDPQDRNRLGNLYLRHFGADNFSYSDPCVTTFTDARDGHVYKAFCINGQNWMAENLDYNAPGSLCYDNSSGNCDIYGRLYDWATVMQGADSSSKTPSGVQGVCPKGWHVPSYAEIIKLITFVGGSSGLAGSEMRAPTTWLNNGGGTNTSGWTGLAAGTYLSTGTPPFQVLGTRAAFWTSTTVDIYNHKGDFSISGGQEPVLWGGLEPTYFFSCRCVKDP
jgi:uncharacterized protein (TIGR02145 family)